MLAQVVHIGFAAQEPQQLVDDRLEMQLLGGHQRKAVRQIETHLMPEYRQRSGAGAIVFALPVVQHVAHEVEVRLHGRSMVSERLILTEADHAFVFFLRGVKPDNSGIVHCRMPKAMPIVSRADDRRGLSSSASSWNSAARRSSLRLSTSNEARDSSRSSSV